VEAESQVTACIRLSQEDGRGAAVGKGLFDGKDGRVEEWICAVDGMAYYLVSAREVSLLYDTNFKTTNMPRTIVGV
jgi:hypothetical protein